MRILLVKTSSLGDVVHNLPVVSDIHRELPESTVDWVVEEAFAEIPRLHAGVTEVIPVAVRRWRRRFAAPATWNEIRRFRRTLRTHHYDAVIDTQGLLKSALITRTSTGRSFGYAADAAREPIASRFYDSTFAISKAVHAVERNRRLAAAALRYETNGPVDFGLRTAPLAAAWIPSRDYAVLLTAASRKEKLWAETHWLALAADLYARGLAVVLPAGTATERNRAVRLADNMRKAVVAPRLGLAELAGVLSGAKVVVGLDTGLTHLAAAVDTPVIALFSGSIPALTGVWPGPRAMNLGALMAPPTPREVIAALYRVMAR